MAENISKYGMPEIYIIRCVVLRISICEGLSNRNESIHSAVPPEGNFNVGLSPARPASSQISSTCPSTRSVIPHCWRISRGWLWPRGSPASEPRSAGRRPPQPSHTRRLIPTSADHDPVFASHRPDTPTPSGPAIPLQLASFAGIVGASR